jgi:hypothetical protein
MNLRESVNFCLRKIIRATSEAVSILAALVSRKPHRKNPPIHCAAILLVGVAPAKVPPHRTPGEGYVQQVSVSGVL